MLKMCTDEGQRMELEIVRMCGILSQGGAEAFFFESERERESREYLSWLG